MFQCPFSLFRLVLHSAEQKSGKVRQLCQEVFGLVNWFTIRLFSTGLEVFMFQCPLSLFYLVLHSAEQRSGKVRLFCQQVVDLFNGFAIRLFSTGLEVSIFQCVSSLFYLVLFRRRPLHFAYHRSGEARQFCPWFYICSI